MATRDDLERLDDEELDLDDAELLEDELPEDTDLNDELSDEEVSLDLADESEPELPKAEKDQTVKTSLPGSVIGSGTKLNVDVAVVIDVTGSMEDMINAIKRDVTNLRALVYDKLNENLTKKRPDRTLNKMRVRVIAYRDYNYDWEAALQPQHGPMLMSDFFDLDDEDDCAALQRFVDQLEATGGVDAPESALEALHYAINSDWDREAGIMHRNVIIHLTDAPGLPLEDERNKTNPHYPTDPDMPKSLVELQAEYSDEDKISQRAQRLLVFAPQDSYPWNEVKEWNPAVMNDVLPDSGMEGIDMEPIIAALTGSLS